MEFTSVALLLCCLAVGIVNVVCGETVSVVIRNVGTFEGFTQAVDYPQGKNMLKTAQVDTFLGIPYAKPPVGDLRFAKTKMLKSYKSIVNASNFGPMCTQERVHLLPKRFPTSEDCLYLNIYKPSNGQNLAVMVFLHRGFGLGTFGNGGSNYISGEVFAVYADVIVVTLNYRLGLLGFYATDEKENVSRGNYGLWDQHEALKWINKNIAGFGGDPNKVTLVGQQTGAMCALYQAMYPGNKGLFQQVIAQSGSPTELAKHYEGAFTVEPNSYGISYSLGCLISDFEDTMGCLRNYSYDKLELLGKTLQWPVSPVYDGEFIKADPKEMLNPANTKYSEIKDTFDSIKLIMGYNNMDGLSFLTNLWVPKFMWEILKNDNYKVTRVNKEVFRNTVNYSINQDMYGVPYRNEPEPLNTVLSRYHNILHPDDYRQVIVQYSTDYYYLTPSLLLIDMRRQALSKSMMSQRKLRQSNTYETHLYKFSVDLDFSFRYQEGPSWAVGANNGDELPFLFGFSRAMLDSLNVSKRYVPSDEMLRVSEQIMTKWGEFIKQGTVESSGDNGNGVDVPRWPSCFETGENSDVISDVNNLKYWEISISKPGGDPASQIQSDYAGVMGRFWMSMKRFVSGQKGEGAPEPEHTGDWLGLDPNTSETIIVILIIIIVVLISSLLILVCCLCLKKRNANYDAVIEMKL